MDFEHLVSLRDIDFSDVSREIHNYLREQSSDYSDDPLAHAAIAAILYLINDSYVSDISKVNISDIIESKIKDETASYYLNEIVKRHEQFITEKANMYPSDKLLALLLYDDQWDFSKSSYYNTPDTLCDLVCALLDIDQGDKVADFGCGRGNFLINAYFKNPHATYTGIEINGKVSTYLALRKSIAELPFDVEQTDIFAQPKNNSKYDKIFCDCGFGVRMSDLKISIAQIVQDPTIKDVLSKVSYNASGEWAYALAILQRLEKHGRAIQIMGSGSTFNELDRPLRKYFIDRGYIESIIILPGKLFSSTAISAVLIVFSHNNKTINMIDATEMYSKGRRNNYFSKENIEEILNLIGRSSRYSTVVPYEKVIEEDYQLFPRRYIDIAPEIKNGAPLGKLVKEIKRGIHIRANLLDELISTVETDVQYLALKDIDDGFVAEKLPYLKQIEPNWNDYCVEDRNVVLSKNIAPLKVAVVNVPNGKKIVASDNFYIIRVDESKLNPYYLKAFFESALGKAMLKNASVGSVLQTISLGDLKAMIIPTIPLEEQKKFEQHYTAIIDEIKLLNRKIDKSKTDLRELINQFNEEVSQWR